MKKLIVIVSTLLFTSSAFAAWTLTPTVLYHAKHYMEWQVVCTSDGDALSATDLVALMPDRVKYLVQGSSQLIMTVKPGTATTAPTTTIDVTLTDARAAIFAETGYSESANTTGISLATDYNQYPTVFDKFYLTLNDIGDSGDQVTLIFFCWIE